MISTGSLYGSLFIMETKEVLKQLRLLEDPTYLRDFLWVYISARVEYIRIIASENKEEIVQRMAKYYLSKER